jgi:hypothetical protein
MIAIYNVKNPPKRKIPKMRVGRKHHYTMIFPKDFIGVWGNGFILKGMPYINYFDSFLEDCHKMMYKSPLVEELINSNEVCIYTACLN